MSDLFKPAGRLVLQGDYENALGLVNTMMRIGMVDMHKHYIPMLAVIFFCQRYRGVI